MWNGLFLLMLSILTAGLSARKNQLTLFVSYILLSTVFTLVAIELHQRYYSAPKCYRRKENSIMSGILLISIYLGSDIVKQGNTSYIQLLTILSAFIGLIWFFYLNSQRRKFNKNDST